MSYTVLMNIKDTFSNSPILKRILSKNKKQFSEDDELITIAIGMLNELNVSFSKIKTDIYVLNNELYEIIKPIQEYSNKPFNKYGTVNAYKLYDVFKVDLTNLLIYINKVDK